MSKTSRACTVPGCDRPFHSSFDGTDYCKLHYDRRYRGNDVGAAEPQLHYPDSAAALPADERSSCSVQPCPGRATTRGMCSAHYQRWRAHDDPTVVKTRRVNDGGCTVAGCPDDAYVRQMCTKHYQRWKTHGDPLHETPNNAAECSEPGCEKKPKSRGLCSAHYEAQRVAAKR